MRRVLGKVINSSQSVFLGGRQLLHNMLVANEVVEEAKRRKKCLLFEVYFDKAYDWVSWEFLLYMLQRLGFDAKWSK